MHQTKNGIRIKRMIDTKWGQPAAELEFDPDEFEWEDEEDSEE